MEQKITLSDYNIIPVGAQFFAPIRGVQGALPPARVLTSMGILKAGSRGAAPGGVSGERCLGDSVKGPPDFLPPFAPEGGVPKNLYLKAAGVWEPFLGDR